MGNGEGNEGHESYGSNEGHESYEQEETGGRQEGFCPHQGLDYCCAEGQEGFGREGLRCNQEGFSSLQESQGALPVSVHEHAKASAQGVGMSTPFERRCFGWRYCEHR